MMNNGSRDVVRFNYFISNVSNPIIRSHNLLDLHSVNLMKRLMEMILFMV